jgi:hypothetical protein
MHLEWPYKLRMKIVIAIRKQNFNLIVIRNFHLTFYSDSHMKNFTQFIYVGYCSAEILRTTVVLFTNSTIQEPYITFRISIQKKSFYRLGILNKNNI